MTVKELATKLKDMTIEGKGDLQVNFKDGPTTYPIFFVQEWYIGDIPNSRRVILSMNPMK